MGANWLGAIKPKAGKEQVRPVAGPRVRQMHAGGLGVERAKDVSITVARRASEEVGYASPA